MGDTANATSDLRIREWPRPRARLGLIIPSANTLTEPQLSRYAPPDVEIHVTRIRVNIDLTHSLLDDLPAILDAASLLADCRSDLIVYHCTGTSMGSGKAAETQMVAAIGKATGLAATSTASGIVAAFRALAAPRVVLLSPYTQAINDHEKRFLTEHGIDVLRDRGLELPMPEGMCGATPDVWVQSVLDMRDPKADAYFITCTNVQSMEAIEELEQRLGKPVVTSNQAALWHALRLSGIGDTIRGLGQLLTLPQHEATHA